jgi:hypothetical protein
LLLLSATVPLLSCSDSIAPRDGTRSKTFAERVKNPATDMQALPPMEVDLSATPGTITVGSIPFVEGVIADISITGLIHLQSEDVAWPIHYTGDLDPAGVGVPNGSCLLDAKLYFSKLVSGGLGGGPSCLIPRTMADYTTRALIGGNITATRGPLPVTNNYCDGPCVYEATGSQHISIRPLAGDLTFKATWNTQSGKTLFIPLSASNYYVMVRFQEFTNPSGLTLKPLFRSWKKADSTLTGNRTDIMECANGNWQANPATYPGLVCDINIKESGTMTTLTRINGVQHTDTAIVYCNDSIAILNYHRVRQGMLAVFDSSGYKNPYTQRIERAFFILQDTTAPGTEPYVWLVPQRPDADACTVGKDILDFSGRPSGTKLLAWGHDHLIPVDTLMICKDSTGNYQKDSTGAVILWKTLLGVSFDDWDLVRLRNDPAEYSQFVGPIYHYVPTIDGDLWVLKPGQMPASPVLLPANNLKWGKGQCAWPKTHL